MDRFWLKNYPQGMPADIDWTQYSSLVQLLEEAFAKYRDRKAYVGFGKAITFGEIDELSKRVAAWLQSKGLAKGDLGVSLRTNQPVAAAIAPASVMPNWAAAKLPSMFPFNCRAASAPLRLSRART